MFSKAWRAGALSLLLAAPVVAQDVDQSGGGDTFTLLRSFSQSFTPEKNTSTGAAIFAFAFVSVPIQFHASLWDGLPGAPGSNLLANASTATFWDGRDGSIYGERDVFWSTPVSVTPGHEYFLSFLIENTSQGQVAVSSTDDYARGGAGGTTYPDIGFIEFGQNVEVDATP
jgi:hypothetical protein